MTDLVFGVGFNNKKYPASKGDNHVAEYAKWMGMLNRCYNAAYQKDKPTYVGCSISENFKSYSYFYEWCQEQVGFRNKGWHLDKDILVKGNKIYSEDVCVFVPREINGFFLRSKKHCGVYPTGVYFNTQRGKFKAQCHTQGRGQKHLGHFDTPQQAFCAYKAFKEVRCKELANKWKDQIDPRVYEVMMVWEVPDEQNIKGEEE